MMEVVRWLGQSIPLFVLFTFENVGQSVLLIVSPSFNSDDFLVAGMPSK